MVRPKLTALKVEDRPHERVVSLFRNGSNQAVRIPKEFEFAGSEVIMRRDGHRLVLEPMSPASLGEVLHWIASEGLDAPGFEVPEDSPPGAVSI